MRQLLLIFTLTLISCRYTPTEPKSEGKYPTNIGAIIEENCLGNGCHSSPNNDNYFLDLSSWDAMTKGSIFFNEVIPFYPSKSHLFGHINTDSTLAPIIQPTMPNGKNPLSSNDQKTFFNWIKQGAKDADRKIPYDEVTKKIFTINQSEGLFSVIDADSKRLIRIEPVGDSGVLPSAIAVMPDFSSLIVATVGEKGSIKQFNVSSYNIINEFNSNLIPNQIALTPDGSKGYLTDISSSSSNLFASFDLRNMKLLKTISTPLLLLPYAVSTSPDGHYTYISGYNSDNILRIDTRTDSIISNLPVGQDVEIPVSQDYSPQYLPSKILITSDSKMMYVTCIGSSEIVVIDLLKDAIVSRIKLPISPRAEALSPDGSELWTASWENTVNVISTATNQIVATIDSVSQSPHDMIFTPDGKFVYIACEYLQGGEHHHHSLSSAIPSSFVVIDRKTRKIVQIEELPGFSVGVVCGYKN